MTNDEINRFLATEVMGWRDDDNLELGGWWSEDGYIGSVYDFTPATDFHDAWAVVKHIAPLITQFDTADGYTMLWCGHWGDHGDCVKREYTEAETGELLDPRPWSFHIHLGIIGEDSGCPARWGTGEMQYCAVGATEQEAICQAVIRAYTKP